MEMLKHTMLVLQPKIKTNPNSQNLIREGRGGGGGGGNVISGFRVFVISNVFLCAQGSKTLSVNYSFQWRDETGVTFSFRK